MEFPPLFSPGLQRSGWVADEPAEMRFRHHGLSSVTLDHVPKPEEDESIKYRVIKWKPSFVYWGVQLHFMVMNVESIFRPMTGSRELN